MVALSIVESRQFRALLHTLDPRYNIPTRKQLTNVLLKERFDEVFDLVKVRLKNVNELSLTMDIWSNRQMRSYCGITIHYIHDWKLESAMLACNRFKGRHTGENIFQEYETPSHLLKSLLKSSTLLQIMLQICLKHSTCQDMKKRVMILSYPMMRTTTSVITKNFLMFCRWSIMGALPMPFNWSLRMDLRMLAG